MTEVRKRLARYFVDTENYDRSIGCPISEHTGEAFYHNDDVRWRGAVYARRRWRELELDCATRADMRWARQFNHEALVAILEENDAENERLDSDSDPPSSDSPVTDRPV